MIFQRLQKALLWSKGLRRPSVLENCFVVLANHADPDEMLHSAEFHLGLHYLSKYPLWGSSIQRVNWLIFY